MRLTLCLATALLVAAAAAKQLPSGERHFAKTGIEPGYDDRTGELVEAAKTPITTEEQLDTAIDAGDAFTVETPITCRCSLVSAATYNRGTPVPPVAP